MDARSWRLARRNCPKPIRVCEFWPKVLDFGNTILWRAHVTTVVNFIAVRELVWIAGHIEHQRTPSKFTLTQGLYDVVNFIPLATHWVTTSRATFFLIFRSKWFYRLFDNLYKIWKIYLFLTSPNYREMILKKTSLLIRRKNFYPRKMKCVNDQNWLNLKFRGGRSQVEPQPTSSVKILLILWNKVAVATLINFEIENFWRKMKLFIKTGTETLLRIFNSFSFLDLAVKFCSILFILWKFNRFFSDVIYGRTFWLSFKIFI